MQVGAEQSEDQSENIVGPKREQSENKAGTTVLEVLEVVEGLTVEEEKPKTPVAKSAPDCSLPSVQQFRSVKTTTSEDLFYAQTPPDSSSVVRPDVPPKNSKGAGGRRKAHRTLEEVRKDLGIREPWFAAICSVHPVGKKGVKEGAEAFERKVTPDAAGHALAQEIYRGAKEYAALCNADSAIKPKWMQGWINEERWRDDNSLPSTPKTKSQMRAEEIDAMEFTS